MKIVLNNNGRFYIHKKAAKKMQVQENDNVGIFFNGKKIYIKKVDAGKKLINNANRLIFHDILSKNIIEHILELPKTTRKDYVNLYFEVKEISANRFEMKLNKK